MIWYEFSDVSLWHDFKVSLESILISDIETIKCKTAFLLYFVVNFTLVAIEPHLVFQEAISCS